MPRLRITHIASLFSARDPQTLQQGPVSSAMLAGFSSAAQEHYATVHLCTVHPDQVARMTDSAEWPPVLREGFVEGLILHAEFPADVVKSLLRRFAMVSVIHRLDGPIDCIDHDDQAGARQLVAHLVSRGHRRIGFIGASCHPEQSRQRQTGYIAGLLEAGLPFDERMVFCSDSDLTQSDARSAEMVAAVRTGVTAFVCAHDDLGYRFGSLLLQAGLRVSRDVSLCGFDDLPTTVPDVPKLTTSVAPFQRIGAAALERLMARLAAPKMDPVRIVFPCELREGGSVSRV
jgi:DNA-binding LacI/PurR family transcriptional regulator